jgi:bacillithiol synthase
MRRFPWIRRLASDYVYDFERLAPFFQGDPALASARERAVGRAQGWTRDRDGIVAVLRAQQERRRAPAEAIAAADRLRNPHTVAIVTGQQAGLFGGPLFTLLKTVTAMRLAERVAAEQHVPVVTIFWVDAEDHDWDEVKACSVLDGDLQLRRVALPEPPGAGERPVASVALDEAVRRAAGELGTALAHTEFTPWLMALLGKTYRPGAGMADAFACWMEALLGARGLIVFESSDPAAKPLAAPIFARELVEPGRTAELAASAGARLAAQGYYAQVVPQPDSVALFHLDGGRRPIRRAGGDVIIGDRTRPAAEVAAEVMATAARFSPNVLLRPVVQDTLFPTACYVAGPSELAYLAQLGDVYRHFGVPMPLIQPRASATILDSAATRFLTRYDLPFEALQPRDEAALNRLLELQLPPAVEQALEHAQQAIQERMAALVAAVPAIDSTLAGAARTTRTRMEHDLRTLHGKIIQAAKRRDETLRRQFTRAQAQAFPGGEPQERALGGVFFLNRYGEALVDRLLADLPLEAGQHYVLTI